LAAPALGRSPADGQPCDAGCRRLTLRPTASTAAYQAYLRGRFFWNKRTAADLAAAIDSTVMVRVFAICVVGANMAPELGLFLSRLNFGLMFGRFSLDTERRAIWFDEALLGEEFREEELRFAVNVVAKTADQWDDPLKQMFGGATYQELLKGQAQEPTPTVKPGAGSGLYL